MRVADKRSTARSRSGSEGTSDRALEAVRVRLLGGFRVSVGSRTIGQAEWPLQKAANLLKLLALAPGHRLHRERVMDALWPDSGRRAASNSLRRTLHSARRVLDPDAGSRYLASEDEQLVLCPDTSLWVDVEAFEEAAAAARRSRVSAAYRAALDLYAGDLLPSDRYEEWAEEKRGESRRLHLELLVELAEAYEERSDLARAVEALRMAVAKEPALEEAHAGLMRHYAISGREGEALAQYERLRATLSKGLGFRPSTATKRLRDEIASGEFPSTLASLTGAPREERPLQFSGHNLPAPRTSFVGRERELLEVKRELAMTRLLTLTGTGGSGKTRLALEVARSLLGAYPDGVWLVELAPLSERAHVPQAVARALGVKERPAQPLSDTLAEVLRTKQALLVLDNCEHLVEAVAPLVDVLLDACPRLRVLATSREGLGIAGEMKWLVSSLSVPDPRQQPTAEELERYESVRLFVERAHYRNPAFVLTPQNMHAVAQICERLDGIPLAIELAAARVGLSVEQIATRLDDSLRLLTTGSRTSSARQRTLRGALDWSYDLLSEPERVLFGQLSVFAGGWTLEAAEAAALGENVKEDEILDLLSSLVDKSLVVAEATGKGAVRYGMLEPVRQYSRERLGESGEVEAIRRAHARFFLALAEEADSELRGPRQGTWLERLETEHDNMRAALTWSVEGGDAEQGLRFAGALAWFWGVRGHYAEGRRWLEELLSKASAAPITARAKALVGAGRLMALYGDYEPAEITTKEGLRLYQEIGDRKGIARSRADLGWITLAQGHLERTRTLTEGLARNQESDDSDVHGRGLETLGWLAWDQGYLEQGRSLLEDGLEISRKSGDIRGIVYGLTNVGYAAMLQGDYERAKALTEEGLTLSRELGDQPGIVYLLCNLGTIAQEQGDYERAAELFKESIKRNRRLGNRAILAELVEGIAGVVGAYGGAVRAARLYGAAEALREAIGVPLPESDRPRYERHVAAACFVVDEQTWKEAWAEGKAMGAEQVVEYALSGGDSSTLAKRTVEQTVPTTVPPPTLTRREREVAKLVAQGLTNRQIAEALFVSERTIDHHVSNILKKLSLSSREQVASRLGDHN
jgi:predicted ATPase/DNA-binding SARP family transcriptional activator/DNA-binding CsgD family transcriptional regulator